MLGSTRGKQKNDALFSILFRVMKLTAKIRLHGIFAQYHIKTLLQSKRQINRCKMTRSYWLISWQAYQYSFVPFQTSVSARLRIQISRLSFVLATRVKNLRETARSEPKERSLYSQAKAVRKKSYFINYNANLLKQKKAFT